MPAYLDNYSDEYKPLAVIFHSPRRSFEDFVDSKYYKDYIRYGNLLNIRYQMLNSPMRYPHTESIMKNYYTGKDSLFIKRLERRKQECRKYGLI